MFCYNIIKLTYKGVIIINTYEKLENEACEINVKVINKPFNSKRIKGLYCDNIIAVNSNIETLAEKNCIVAEELGHHCTTTGNILIQTDTNNRKQELKARLWAYNKLIGLQGLIECHKARCNTIYDMAEHLNVTEEFILEAINCYKSKYGKYITIDNYVICFEPNLYIIEQL